MARRLQALFLTLILLFTCATTTVFAENGDSFDDWNTDNWEDSSDVDSDDFGDENEVPEDIPVFPDVWNGKWYYRDIMTLYYAGVIDGYTDGKFYPEASVTTGQALKMILLAAGYAEPERVASHWARGYLNLALDEEILIRGEITDLDITIARGLVAKVAARALKLERQSQENHFTDTTDDAAQALYEVGIITGYKDGTFLPNRTLTRAELSAIVRRIYDYREAEQEPETPSNSEISLRTTETCIQMLKDLEGFQQMPYWDYQQYSIGYGSACKVEDYPNGITREEADLLLRQYIQAFEKDLDAFLEKNNITLSDNQYDALICFTYNLGSSWMRGTKLANLLISGHYTENEFACAYGVWCHVGTDAQIHTGLIGRRVRELKMFFDNDYTNSPENTFYYVIYQTDEGELDTDVGLYRAGTPYTPLPSAKSAGNTFLGWFTEDGYELTVDEVARGNLTVTAAWENSSSGNDDWSNDQWNDDNWEDDGWDSRWE